MKNIILGLLLVLLTVASADAATNNRQRVGIAAVVNDEVVTFSDVANRVNLYLSGKMPPADVRRKMEQQILNRLIDEKLQMQEAKSLGIVVGEDQVSAGFAEVARQNGVPPEEFRRRLQASGVSVGTLYDQLRAEIAWSQVIKRKLRPQVNVSESEIDSEMDNMVRSSGKPEYRVAEIFLAVTDVKDENKTKEDADKIVIQITKGASFAQIARQFSQAPGASTGGDIGWVQEGQLDAKLDQVLAKMQPGQVSPPIRTDKGFHILFLRDVRMNKIVTDAAASQAAPEPEAPAQETRAIGETFLHLKQIVIPVAAADPTPIINAKTVRAASLKTEVTSCEQMDQKAKDFIFEGTGDLGKIAASTLPDAVRLAVLPLETGVLSDPVRVPAGIAVLMVCAREETRAPAAAATLTKKEIPLPKISAVSKTDEAAREQIAGKIGQQRLTQLQERYLRDLRATAFIDKRL